MFFNDLFRDTFVCLDKDGNETKYIADLVSMQVKKSGEVSPVEDFWSHDSNVSIYHDYTVMNKLLLEKYGTCFDAEKLLEIMILLLLILVFMKWIIRMLLV